MEVATESYQSSVPERLLEDVLGNGRRVWICCCLLKSAALPVLSRSVCIGEVVLQVTKEGESLPEVELREGNDESREHH